MPRIRPAKDTNITILDDEGTVILDIDPTSLLFWGRNVMLKSGFEVHLLEEDFVSFGEGDVVRYREDGVSRFREGDDGYEDGDEDEDGGEVEREGTRKRKRNSKSVFWSAGVMVGDVDGDGVRDSENEGRTSLDESGESSSAIDSENMSGVGDVSEQSDIKSQDSTTNGPPNAKKAKVEIKDVRGAETNRKTERNVQQDSLDQCDNMIDGPMEVVDM